MVCQLLCQRNKLDIFILELLFPQFEEANNDFQGLNDDMWSKIRINL